MQEHVVGQPEFMFLGHGHTHLAQNKLSLIPCVEKRAMERFPLVSRETCYAIDFARQRRRWAYEREDLGGGQLCTVMGLPCYLSQASLPCLSTYFSFIKTSCPMSDVMVCVCMYTLSLNKLLKSPNNKTSIYVPCIGYFTLLCVSIPDRNRQKDWFLSNYFQTV